MHSNFRSALIAALGDNPTHIVCLRQASKLTEEGGRRAHLFLNPITAAWADHKDNVKIRADGDTLSVKNQDVVSVCLAAGRSVGIAFESLPHALDFLGDCFDTVESAA
jgi:hypothetical protein